MIESMTGYSKIEVTENQWTCNVEAKSVNHRYLEVKIHLPKEFHHLEDGLKKSARNLLSRGKVDVYLTLESDEADFKTLMLDEKLLNTLMDVVEKVEAKSERKVGIALADLLSVKDLLAYKQNPDQIQSAETLFQTAVDQALTALVEMRKKEGSMLSSEITSHLDQIKELVDEVPRYKDQITESYRVKLGKNLESVGSSLSEDDPRIMQEIGILLDRLDITEEIERFGSHIQHFKDLLSLTEPVGRKMDFLLQEMNREANTLCSKTGNIRITEIGIELKSEIEKIREQIQNIQ